MHTTKPIANKGDTSIAVIFEKKQEHLSHRYTRYLLERGTGLRFIQELWGHSSGKTTETYTNLSTKSLQNIKSLFNIL